MREIKFRGKRFYNNKWVYGNLFIDKDGERYILENDYLEQDGHHLVCNSDTPVFMMEETVSQYTGLKDKSGVEIYEGDIVKVDSPYSFQLEVGIICYNDGCFDIIVNTGGRDYLKCHTVNHAVKVIGNIYDNPELLEAKQNE